MTSIMSAMLKNQLKNTPVHEWPLANIEDGLYKFDPSHLLVEEYMDRELFTVRENDILAFVSDMIDWQRIRYVPVEDEKVLIKLDWNINDEHRASLVYNYNDGFRLDQSDERNNSVTLDNHFYEVGAKLNSIVGSLLILWITTFFG